MPFTGNGGSNTNQNTTEFFVSGSVTAPITGTVTISGTNVYVTSSGGGIGGGAVTQGGPFGVLVSGVVGVVQSGALAASVSGTVASTQGGAWSVQVSGTVTATATLTNPLTTTVTGVVAVSQTNAATFTGAVTQGGPWNQLISGTVGITQSGALGAQVSGVIGATQSGAWSVQVSGVAAAPLWVTGAVGSPVWVANTGSVAVSTGTFPTVTVTSSQASPVWVTQSGGGSAVTVTNTASVTATFANPVWVTGTVATVGGAAGIQYGTGSATPTTGTLVLGTDPTNKAVALQTDANRVLAVNVVSGGAGGGAVTQGGAFGILVSGTVGILQSGALGAQVSGVIGATQSGAWSVQVSGVSTAPVWVTSTITAPLQVASDHGPVGVSGTVAVTQGGALGTQVSGIIGITQSGALGVQVSGVVGITQSGTLNALVSGVVGVTGVWSSPVVVTGAVANPVWVATTGGFGGGVQYGTGSTTPYTGTLMLANQGGTAVAVSASGGSLLVAITSGGTGGGAVTQGGAWSVQVSGVSTAPVWVTGAVGSPLWVAATGGFGGGVQYGTGSTTPYTGTLMLANQGGTVVAVSASGGALLVAISGNINAVFSGSQAVSQSGAWTSLVSGVVGVTGVWSGPVVVTGAVGSPVWVANTGSVAVSTGTMPVVVVTSTVANPVMANLVADTTGGVNSWHTYSAATTNLANIKAGAGSVYGYNFINLAAGVRFVKLYNLAVGPGPASSTVYYSIALPVSGGVEEHLAVPINFGTGIAVAIVSGASDTDNTAVGAGEVVGNINWM